MVSGLGIKNKALEAMSMAKPVVATQAAASGIEAERGKHIFIEDDPVGFADRVKALLGDEGLRRRTGEEARGLVTREYSWENAVIRYEEVYGKMLRECSVSEKVK
jgi:glycosyltransferase involved in cell wall biosynthesis